MLDIQRLLGDIGVPYWTSGKNVSEGWTSVSCAHCGDRSNHGAFSSNGMAYSCFICGKHSVKSTIAAYTSWEEAFSLIQEYSSALLYKEETAVQRASRVEWPPEGAVPMPSIHAQYLHDRGYNPKQIRDMYSVSCCYHSGPMKYRIVIPIFENGIIVSYVGRDITGKSPLKYKNLAETKSILSVKETIFNIDNVYKTAIVCEGPFDAMRFGVHGVCTYGLQYTARQINALAGRLKRAVICFDNETIAQTKAMDMGESLSMLGVEVDILEIEANDPGELTQKQADRIKLALDI